MEERAALRTPQPDADRIGFYGKLPSHGDFVSTGLGRRLQDALDTWLQAGLQRLQQVFSGDWEQRFKAMPAWRFVIERHQWGPATLAGIILPSVDRVGRAFPLVVIAQIPDYTGDLRKLCMDDSWFTAAEAIAETSMRGGFDIKVFIASLERLRSPLPGDLDDKAGAPPKLGALWWRSDHNRHRVGFTSPSAPLPADLLRLLEGETSQGRGSLRTPVPNPQTQPDKVASASRPFRPVGPSTSPPQPRMIWAFSHMTHPGTRLSLNADCVLASVDHEIFALADGIGDSSTAAEASRIAIAALAEVGKQQTVDEVVQALKGKLGRAHSLLQASALPAERSALGVSIAVLALHQDNLVISWAGDVRCYILRDGTMRCLTRDHLEVGLKRGLSRYLGKPGPLHPETVTDTVRAGDRFLLCSHALVRSLPERSVAEILIGADLADAAAVLGQEALIANCRDNVSAIVIDAHTADV